MCIVVSLLNLLYGKFIIKLYASHISNFPRFSVLAPKEINFSFVINRDMIVARCYCILDFRLNQMRSFVAIDHFSHFINYQICYYYLGLYKLHLGIVLSLQSHKILYWNVITSVLYNFVITNIHETVFYFVLKFLVCSTSYQTFCF